MSADPAIARETSEDYRIARFCIDGGFLALAIVALFLAPVGNWTDAVWGVEMWEHSDPGGCYVVSALYYFDFSRPLPFIGHPGLTLQLPIAIAAHAAFGLAKLFGEPATFMGFWVEHLRELFILAGALVAIAHVISFHAVYAFAKMLTGSSRAGLIAVVTYVTMYPTLFYATRISVEPLLVSFFLFTLLALWKLEEARAAGRTRAAYGYAALAASAAVGAFYTKVHLAAALPGFAFMQLLLQRGPDSLPLLRRVREKLRFAGAFAGASLVLLILGGLRMDWAGFLGAWSRYIPFLPRPANAPPAKASEASIGNTLSGIWDLAGKNLSGFEPGLTPNGLFTIAEGLILLAAAAGIVLLCIRRAPARRMVTWPLLYLLILLPAAAYRGQWHYLFLHLAVASAAVGYLAMEITRSSPARLRLALAAALVVVVHIPAMAIALSAKKHDARAYAMHIEPFHEALDDLRSERRIAIIGRIPSLWWVHGGHPKWVSSAKEFNEAFSDRFRPTARVQSVTPEWLDEHRIGEIVEIREGGVPVRMQVSEWLIAHPPRRRRGAGD